MLVSCESCKSKFNLDDNLVKESGSKVKCSNCKNIFTVYQAAPSQAEIPDVGLEEQAEFLESSDDLGEEPLDFGLFESEDEQDDEEMSLEDFGLGEEPTGAPEVHGSETAQDLLEEEITPEELGFGQDDVEEATEPLEEDFLGEVEPDEISLESLDLEEGLAAEDDLTLEDVGGGDDVELEEEISFDDLALEEEGLENAITSGDQQDAGEDEELSFDELSLEEEPTVDEMARLEDELTLDQTDEETITFEDTSLQDVVSEGDLTEQALGNDIPTEAGAPDDLDDMEAQLPEGMPVASLEDGEESEVLEEEPMADVPPAPMIEQPAAKKGVSMPLLICLIVVLLGGGAYAAFTFLKGETVRIPFLESLAGSKSAPMDPGNLNISLLDAGISGGFVENKAMGRIFVIKGKVKSSYPEVRNFIRLKGVLYLRDGKVAKDQIVYSGNVLSEGELRTLGREAIKKKLSNRFGDNKSNFKVSSGKELPFMVVFGDLPEDLGEFSVEVVDSVPG